ncbi:MAG: TraR/DksA family transcriptional regulator [Halofilum sp. (in: g-proteobacteria)]|nr:TraR/DksA family transcriptional regulator [Halofilum sp. (in: g-proteobacteria)]
MGSRLSEEQRRHFRATLEVRREAVAADIRAELARFDSQHYVDLAGQVGDLEDQALADLLVDENLAEIHRHVRDLRAVDAALMRLQQGAYGECVDCGEAIDPGRLEAYPTALRCIECQGRYERTHAHEGHPTL